MGRHRRTIYPDESVCGPEVAAGLMALAITLGVVWFGPNAVPNIVRGSAAPTFSGTVTHVVDGDTFHMTGHVRIRVWGLDAPETDTYGGSAATAAMSRLVSGKQLGCTKRDTDRYGRTVSASLPTAGTSARP